MISLHGHGTAFVNWINSQKVQFQDRDLEQGKDELLNELNFDWTIHPPNTWDELFEELSQYHNKFGSTLISRKIDTDLGEWTSEPRHLYATGTLDPEWTSKLNLIGFQWEVDDDSLHWNAMFARLIACKTSYGTVCVPNTSSDDLMLGRWVSFERGNYAKFIKDDMELSSIAETVATRKTSQETHLSRLTRLTEIGFVWNMHHTTLQMRLILEAILLNL